MRIDAALFRKTCKMYPTSNSATRTNSRDSGPGNLNAPPGIQDLCNLLYSEKPSAFIKQVMESGITTLDFAESSLALSRRAMATLARALAHPASPLRHVKIGPMED